MSDSAAVPMPSGISGRVINVVDATGQDATGTFVKGRNVTYQLNTGATGSVFVPLATFSPDSVKAAVLADAQQLHAVSQLKF